MGTLKYWDGTEWKYVGLGESPRGTPIATYNQSLPTVTLDAGVGVWKDIDTMVIPNPGGTIALDFNWSSYIYGTTGTSGDALVEVLISIDGGSTYISGLRRSAVSLNINSDIQFHSFSISDTISDLTPTGDIHIILRGQVYDDNGSGAFSHSGNTYWSAKVIHAEDVVLDNRYSIKNEGYRLSEVVYFTGSGNNFVKANYPGMRAVRFIAVGGGGGGAGSATANSGGPGGGAGGTSISGFIDAADIAASEEVEVGSAGSGGTSPTKGGDSWVDKPGGFHVYALGGEEGAGLSNAHAGRGGGQAGGASSLVGALIIHGGDGQSTGDPTLYTTSGIFPGGSGGNSTHGGGGQGAPARAANAAGGVGRGYGGGGGGGYNRNSNPGGGAGAPGIVIAEIYV